MRILLQLVVVLSGLLLAREFMIHSHEHLRLVLRWASIASENIATVHEAPPSVAPVSVGPIAEVSAQSIGIVHDVPALVALITVVPLVKGSAQSIPIVHDEPPTLLAPSSVAQIAQVTAQSIAIVRRPPVLVGRKDVAQIAEVTPKSSATVADRPVMAVMNGIAQIAEVSKSIRTVDNWSAPVEVAPVTTASVRSIDAVQGWSVLAPRIEVEQIRAAQSLAPSHKRPPQPITSALAQAGRMQASVLSIITVRDEPPRQLVPTAVALIPEVSTQSLVIVEEAPAPVVPMSACEQIWDQMTHMSRAEWSEACRRVDELRLVVRNDKLHPSGER